MATITTPVNGTDVTFEVLVSIANKKITVTFLAPPGSGGPAQERDFESDTPICSKKSLDGCTYCMSPAPPLINWGQVSDENDLDWDVSCNN